MSAELTFFVGLILAGLFGWYFLTASDRYKRILGSVLTVSLTALAIAFSYPPETKIPRGLDLKGGTSFLLRLMAEPDESGVKRDITPAMVDQAREVIRKRVDSMGTSEPIIVPEGADRILVQIPGLDATRLDETRTQLQRVAKLEFKMVHPQSDGILAGTVPPDPAYKIEVYREKKSAKGGEPIEERLVVKKKADIPGSMVSKAFAFYDTQGWGVSLGFTADGGKLFAKLTQENVGRRFAIVLDSEVQSAPVIREAITGGSAQITGSFSEQEARNLASVLENPLQTPVRIEETRSASASLGADSINSGITSGLVGISLTVCCVLAYYRFAGVVANLALLVNFILLFGSMGLLGTVVTLPGIAGIILTLGMAIDANVLIYERLREELAAGKPVRAAVDAAFDRAFTAIFDSNVTTLITAVILFWKASGPIKGFAVALSLGIVATLFTALVVTRNLFAWAIELGVLKRVGMGDIFGVPSFDFLGKRKAAVTISVLVIATSVGLFAMRGEKNFGVDFKGGDRVVLEATKEKPELAKVREAVESMKTGDAVVQIEKSAAKEFFTIRCAVEKGDQIAETLTKNFANAGFRVEQVERVGGLVGGELAKSSLMALGLGMVGILFYVTARFEFSFALGALVALVHDVVITMGVFALLGRELSLVIVGAVLTIAGYSVNDTIVVFDRIREGFENGRPGSVMDIMNQCINETLSRTMLTGGVTLLTTSALFFFGGPVLADFALTILIGVLVGTYSSVFVAAPIVLWWGKGRREAIAGRKAVAETSA